MQQVGHHLRVGPAAPGQLDEVRLALLALQPKLSRKDPGFQRAVGVGSCLQQRQERWIAFARHQFPAIGNAEQADHLGQVVGVRGQLGQLGKVAPAARRLGLHSAEQIKNGKV